MKKILSILLCIVMIASLAVCFAACGGDDKKGSQPTVDTSLKSGTPAAVGDVFELPEIKQASGAPVLAEINSQAYPGDSVVVSGEGLSASGMKVYVYSQSTKDNGKAHEAQFTVVDDNYISVLIDESLEYGMYAVYVETSAGKSNVKYVNKAKVWNIGLPMLTEGESLSIYGENLTTDNENLTHVYLVSEDGKEYCEAQTTFADAGKITITVPKGLKADGKYKILVHNGHGGEEGFAESPEMLTYSEETAVQFNGNTVNVKDYGADPASRTNDDSEAIQAAIDAAEAGDTLYFPAGAYFLKSAITVDKSIKFEGAGTDKTIIYAGYNIEGDAITFNGGPVEITKICFEQKRTKGKVKGGFITFKADLVDIGHYNIYIHDNVFNQWVSETTSRSYKFPINVTSAYGVRIENNKFDAFAIGTVYNAEKVSITGNELLSNLYVGIYYGQDGAILTHVDDVDVSSNKLIGKDYFTDDTGEFTTDDYTVGRGVVVQGHGSNMYISHNEFLRVGIPNANAGEVILLENLGYKFNGPVVSADETSITLGTSDKNKIVAGNVITINNGKGKSQYRTVVQRNGNTVVVDKPWDIIPDSTSHAIVNYAFKNVYSCENTIDGYTNYQKETGSTTGIQVYGSAHNLTFSKNIMKNMPIGICHTAYYTPDSDDAKAIIAWSSYDRNVIENCAVGVRFFCTQKVDGSGDIPGEMTFGVTFRKNEFNKIPDYEGSWKNQGAQGIQVGNPVSGFDGGTQNDKWWGPWMVANLFENNTFNECAYPIACGTHQSKNILRDTSESNGATVTVGSGCSNVIKTAY